jgi:multidrug resistance efflux pump
MRKALWMLCLMTTFCALGFDAYAQNIPVPPMPTVRNVQPVESGGYLVEIDGQKFRALPVETLRQILKDREELDGARNRNALLLQRVALLEQSQANLRSQLDFADRQRLVEQRIRDQYRELYAAERDLRIKAVALVGKRGRLSAFFNHPATRAVLAIAPFALRAVK